MNFSASDLERLKRNLPRFRPGEEGVLDQYQSQPPSHGRVDLESSIEKRLFDKLIGPLAHPPTSSRAPRVGSAGMSLRPSALGDLSAGGGPLGHLKQSAISTPSAGTVSSPPHATSSSGSSGSSGSSPPTQPYSGAGGGLMGVLASRLNTVEEESVALRSLLSARERDVVVRDKELLALRRQLETALSEARTARQDSTSPVRMLHTSSGSRGGVSTSAATSASGGLSVVGKAGIAMGSPSSSISGGGGSGLLHSSSPSLQGVPSPTKGPSPLSPSNSTSATATATASTPFPLATTSTVVDTLMAREASLRAQLARVREELEEVVVDRGELREELEEALGEMRDMKKFLADYGLVWVGGGGKGGGSSAGGGGGGGTTNAPFPPLLSSSFPSNAPSSSSSSVGGGGAPSTTTASNPPPAPTPIDFPFLAFRVQQLNALAGEGKSRVVSKDGAHQLVSEPVGGRLKLTLHRDGFLLRRGPFRPYTRESSRLFIQDILDGFFPYELKESYPEGVLFDLVNKTSEWYEGGGGRGGNNGHGSGSGVSHGGEGEGVGEGEGEGGVPPGFVPFGGSGRSLRDIPKGGSTSNSNTTTTTTTTTTDKRVTRLITMGGGGGSGGGGGEEELFHLPSPPRAFPPPPTTAGSSSSGSISASALLSALPSKVVSSRGDMVDVRGSVARALGMEVGGPPPATPATTAGNAAAAATATAPTSSSISTSTATIKVRLDGSPAPPPLLLHLRADEDTVGYLLSCVAGHRVTDTPFELRSAAPARAFSAGGRDVGLTLRQAGLAPSAVLFVRSAV